MLCSLLCCSWIFINVLELKILIIGAQIKSLGFASTIITYYSYGAPHEHTSFATPITFLSRLIYSYHSTAGTQNSLSSYLQFVSQNSFPLYTTPAEIVLKIIHFRFSFLALHSSPVSVYFILTFKFRPCLLYFAFCSNSFLLYFINSVWLTPLLIHHHHNHYHQWLYSPCKDLGLLTLGIS
jgi:hypothetical protein